MKLVIISILFLQIISFAQRGSGKSEADSTDIKEYNKGLTEPIGIIARSYNDSVVVRWAVSKISHWEVSKKYGFILERAPVSGEGRYGEFKPVREGVFKPWSDEKWLTYLRAKKPSRDDAEVDYESFAYQFGIAKKTGEEKSAGVNEMQALKDSKSKSDWQILFTILSANGSSVAADGLGLRFVDKNIRKGEKYVYRISIAGKSDQYNIMPGYAEVTVGPFNPAIVKQKIYATENDESIELRWKANDNITFYLVERSHDNGKTFNKITKVPLLTLLSTADSSRFEGYQDTLIIANYKPLIYRVYGISSFADKLLIGEVKAMGRDRTPPEQPFLSQPQHISENEIKIKWEMNKKPSPDIKGFYIGRDTSATGEFKYISDLLPPSSREFIDNKFIKDGNNFYLVEAIDTAGNISQSHTAFVALNDTTPPSTPEWETGVMDARGVVTLKIKPNREKDLMGYRILTSNSPEHEFSSIIESFGTDTIDYRRIIEFKDTVSLESTTRFVYYRVTALDDRYNESKLSQVLAVSRVDIVPPAAPVINNIIVTEKSVSLNFASSSSIDAAGHIAYRRIMGEERWDSLGNMGHNDSIFTDSTVKSNVMYEYALTAKDSSGLKSGMSASISARPYYTGVLPVVKGVTIVYDEKRKETVIKWDYEKKEDVYFIIYRTFEKETQKRYVTLKESGTRTFKDEKIGGKGNYTYAIKVFDNLGGESPMSEKVNINVK
jgi:uncharacterized protein